MKNQIYVYQFYVMDCGWEAFPTVKEMIARFNDCDDCDQYMMRKFLDFHEKAMCAALDASVSQGFSTSIHVMPLINNYEASFALAWKAAKGGWCIVVSEKKLSWLEEIESCTLKIYDNI